MDTLDRLNLADLPRYFFVMFCYHQTKMFNRCDPQDNLFPSSKVILVGVWKHDIRKK